MRILTLSAITLILASPAMGQDACEIQRRLQQIDLYDGEITCHIGEQTEAAIRRFQERKGLHVDGIAGEDTLRVLFGEGEEERKAPAVVVERREFSEQERFARCGDEVISVKGLERLGKGRAQDNAVKAWQTHVFEDKALGPDYAMWDSAIDKPTQIRCRPAHANSRWVWKCTAVARPCKAGE